MSQSVRTGLSAPSVPGMKILIVDDHSLFRDGLKLLIREVHGACPILEAGNLEDALVVARQHADCNLVLFDLGLPGACGMAALTRFRTLYEHIPVVVLSGLCSREMVERSLECGAMGFIPKTVDSVVLHAALKSILSGKVYVPQHALMDAHGNEPPLSELSDAFSSLELTQRQREVFKLIIQGRPNKLIARDLGIAESTVKAHVKPILRALRVTSRVGAILEVSRLGLTLE